MGSKRSFQERRRDTNARYYANKKAEREQSQQSSQDNGELDVADPFDI